MVVARAAVEAEGDPKRACRGIQRPWPEAGIMGTNPHLLGKGWRQD